MGKLLAVFFVFLLGCTSVSLVENWKNPENEIFTANKVLIVGMVQNQDVRARFESNLTGEFDERNVEAMRSLDVFEDKFTDSRRTEEELDMVEQKLLDENFDAILLTKIIGSEDRKGFLKTISNWYDYQGRFNDDYLSHQEIYYDDAYYETFTVYHAQTTLYCICEGKERAMIWRGSIDITDPRNIEKSVKEYTRLVLTALEEQDLIFIKEPEHETADL